MYPGLGWPAVAGAREPEELRLHEESELHLANGEFQLARRHPLLLGVMRMAAKSYR